MNALLNLARRGRPPRPKSIAAGEPARPTETTSPSPPGQGAGRDRTPSPVPPGPHPGARRGIDPRWYQIAMLSSLLGYGMLGLEFDLGWGHVAYTLTLSTLSLRRRCRG